MQFVKRFSLFTILLTGLFYLSSPQDANAQWAIGASYEVKTDVPDGEPSTGYGARIDRVLGLPLPLLDLRLRGHFSYFSDENKIDYTRSGVQNATYSTEIKNYDYGLQLIAQANFIVSPYAGIGLGSENYNAAASGDIPTNWDDVEDSSFYWNGVAGLSTNALQVVRPFVEYRYKNITSPNELDQQDIEGLKGTQSRVIVGILLQF